MAVDYLMVEKKLLGKLKINIQEKLPQVLWADDRYLYYVDKDGIVMKAFEPERIEYDLPRVSRGTTTAVVIGKKIMEAENIKFIRQVAGVVEEDFKNWKIREVVILALKNTELYFYTNEGWYIIMNREISADRQLDNLKRLLKQKIENREELEYIDLRIEDRIFYK